MNVSKITDLSKRNILFLVHNYNSFQKDQIESVSRYFNKVFVIVRYKPISRIVKYLPIRLLKKYEDRYVIDKKGVPSNVHVFRAPVLYLPFGLFNRLLGVTHYKAVQRVIRKEGIKFDLIHAHFLWSSGYVGMKLKERYNKKLIVTGHGYDVYKVPFKNSWWKRKIASTLEKADKILTVSEENIRCIKKLGIKGRDIELISNGYNSSLFYPLETQKVRKQLDIPLGVKVLLSVGNLEPVKGHRYLIEAVNLLREKYPKILCYIIGGGSLYKDLKDQIESLGLQENVILSGYMGHEYINKWMNTCDLFVLPSVQESFGIVQLEAMASGKPVVATKTVGSKGIINSQRYGILTEIKNPYSLSEGILGALERRWDKDEILNYAKKYSWDSVSEELLNIYNRTIES